MAHDSLRELLQASGFAFVRRQDMRAVLESCGPLSDWPAFAASWDHLEVDSYLVGHGRYRRRRYAVSPIDAGGGIEREPHQPHYQGQEYNQLFGGVERWFEPIAEEVAASATMATILRWCDRFFSHLEPRSPHVPQSPVGDHGWHVEVHQFRIEARAEAAGHPTPEGAHRDGVDFVAVFMVGRRGIKGGETRVFEADGPNGQRFTLAEPWSLLLLDDARVIHESTPIQPTSEHPGHRDTLVLTYRAGAFQGDD